MKLPEAIAKINQLSHASFNQEQKKLAINMLEKAPDAERKAWYDLIVQRVKLGFTFDVAGVPDHNRIALVEEKSELNINLAQTSNTESTQPVHKLIIGENYDALKNLLITHRNQIDVIYIDPPYNTEAATSEGNSKITKQGQFSSHFETAEAQKAIEQQVTSGQSKFCYRDKYSRTGWLNLLKERLELAKDLLNEQGVIFVSIDDNEYGYLRVLMDEIFGEERFICSFIWEKMYTFKNNNKFVSVNHDYVLCYRRTNQISKFERLPRTEKNNQMYKYDDHDGRGPYEISVLTIKNGHQYKIKINNKIYEPGKYGGWRYSETKMRKLIKEKRIYIPKNNGGRLRIKRYLSEVGAVISSTILKHEIAGHNDGNQKQLNQILNTQSFDYPKGTKLIKYLLKLIPNQQNAIILDFFAGSGTTGHAVMELNQADNGNRQFILVTNDENNIAKKVTYERLHRIILGKTTNQTTDFVWLQKNKPFLKNKLQVFQLQYHDVSFKAKTQGLADTALMQLKRLNPNFKN